MERSQLDRYQGRFPGPQLAMVLASMRAGNTGFRVWKLPREAGEPFLVLWDQGNNVFYLAGEVDNERTLRSVTELLVVQVLPQARAKGVDWFKVRALSPTLEQHLPRMFPGVGLEASPYLFFEHDRTTGSRKRPSIGVSISLLGTTRETLCSGDYTDSEEVREEIRFMWPSEERFYERGFGVLAVHESEIVCWCTAEYVGPTSCGVGIATRPDYQGRGIATAAAARFVEESHRRGLTPCWECRETNVASVRVAEKAGFVRREKELYWIGFLSP
jgi:GNAT superfamily N-acetyltransferase